MPKSFCSKLSFVAGGLVGWWIVAPLVFHKPFGGDWQDIAASLDLAGAIYLVLTVFDNKRFLVR